MARSVISGIKLEYGVKLDSATDALSQDLLRGAKNFSRLILIRYYQDLIKRYHEMLVF